jgi:23S rRNA U2552 (ribose-2'-O)-methylase RlmE/FtsJ
MEPWNAVQWYATAATKDVTPSTFDDSSSNVVILPAQWDYTFTGDEEKLHDYRKRINQYERQTGTSEWEYFKKVVNPYELIYTQKKYDNFPDSICILHPLSRSYIKMIEMLEVSEFYKLYGKATALRSAHVCEGPGGFIEGFLDRCEKHKVTKVTSTAITLRPRQQNVPGWKRAASFLQKHRNVRIEYGPDGTGNLLNPANQQGFIDACVPKVHLFTADGGFDFSTDYDSQEQTIFPLLLASTRVGFETLQSGGFFIMKLFDIYHAGTKDLLYFLSTHFVSWTLYKPATSRPCNPELYFLGRRFTGCDADTTRAMRTWCTESPRRLYTAPLPPAFLDRLHSIIGTSVRNQILYLEKVFALLDASPTERQAQIKLMLQKHEVISFQWCRAFSALYYPERCRLIEALQTCLRAAGLLK